VSAFTLTGHIRPVDPRRDLLPIADLIELCFTHQMDEDGRDYLRHIRQAAYDVNLQRWVRGSNERVSAPLFGYVWEEDNKVVANLTLIPFHREGIWRYLIANVATHPDYRGLGIARRLTQKGIDHVREKEASAVWLQVRDDNPAAYHLYLDLGFKERARRTTWMQANPPPALLPLNAYHISWRQGRVWDHEMAWLGNTYPPEITWNLNFRIDRYSPGVWRSLMRFLNNERIEQWTVHQGPLLLGVAIWDAGFFNAETVWLAPNPECEDEALMALLTLLRSEVTAPRPMILNYPAEHGISAFTRAGFALHNTLIWMEVKF
jgi:ribosomal protein S18 acetylase RimI-like enzyme